MHAIKILLLMACSLFILKSVSANALEEIHSDAPIIKITDQVYFMQGPTEVANEKNRGFRNNLAFVLTSKGVVIIDTGISAAVGRLMLRKIKTVTNQPIVAVFNTHHHGDHWLGNGAIRHVYPNVDIYAHKKMIALAKVGEGNKWITIFNKMTNGWIKGTKVVIPNKAVDNGDIIRIGDTEFLIHHPAKAHTSTDIMIEIKNKQVLFTGDVVRNQFLGPLQDGSFKGTIKAIDHILSLNIKYYIPGHGPAGDRKIAQNYRHYFDILYSNIKIMHAKDMEDYEMKPIIIKKLRLFKAWAGFDATVGSHIFQAYIEIDNDSF